MQKKKKKCKKKDAKKSMWGVCHILYDIPYMLALECIVFVR